MNHPDEKTESVVKEITSRYASAYQMYKCKPINGLVLVKMAYILFNAHDHCGVDWPMNLKKMSMESDVDFIGDVVGLFANFNPHTNTFLNGFVPRCGFIKKEN